MLGLGIDSGSTMTKGIICSPEGIEKRHMIRTSASPREAITRMYEDFYNEEVVCTVTTGYGRELLKAADRKVTEITCHARGCRFFEPDCGGIIDIGGQDCKVIALDEAGNVVDFLMNDKCAAGTGRFMDVMMGILEEDIQKIDTFIADAKPYPISSMCTVFAESEIISLLANDIDKSQIAMGVVDAIALRTANFYSRLNNNGPIFFSGGLSQSKVFCRALEKHLGMPVVTNDLGQYAGALGAALIGLESGE